MFFDTLLYLFWGLIRFSKSVIMPNSSTTRAGGSSSAPLSVSSPPPPPVSDSVSRSEFSQGHPSTSVFSTSVMPSEVFRAGEPLPQAQRSNNSELFSEFLSFMRSRENLSLSQSGSSSFTAPSISSAAFSTSTPAVPVVVANPPSTMADRPIGSSRLLYDYSAGHSRGSRPILTRQMEASINPAPLRCASSLLRARGHNEARSQASAPRGVFGYGADTLTSFDDSLPPSSPYGHSFSSSRLGRPCAYDAEPFPRSFGFDPGLGGDSLFPPTPQDDFSSDQDLDPVSVALTHVASEARSLLLKYQGDLYGTDSFTGASVSEPGGRYSSADSACGGLFVDARPRSAPGITLPEEFVSAFRCLDNDKLDKAIPRTVKRAFAFSEQDELDFFSEKVFAPDTYAFSESLRDPGRPCPLKSRDFAQVDRTWASVAESSTVAARCAAYSTALADLLVRADEMGVVEDDRVVIRELLLNISSRAFSEALRTQLRATHQRRLLALRALNLPKDFNSSAVIRVPREGPYVFGGHFLTAVDSDISMYSRAREVARRVRPRLQSFRRSSSRGGGFVTSVQAAGSARSRPRRRGFSRRSTTRGRGNAQPAASGSAAPGASGNTQYRK